MHKRLPNLAILGLQSLSKSQLPSCPLLSGLLCLAAANLPVPVLHVYRPWCHHQLRPHLPPAANSALFIHLRPTLPQSFTCGHPVSHQSCLACVRSLLPSCLSAQSPCLPPAAVLLLSPSCSHPIHVSCVRPLLPPCLSAQGLCIPPAPVLSISPSCSHPTPVSCVRPCCHPASPLGACAYLLLLCCPCLRPAAIPPLPPLSNTALVPHQAVTNPESCPSPPRPSPPPSSSSSSSS